MKRLLVTALFLLGTLTGALSQASGLTDLKFGQAQIADSQWNVGACMYTATCEIYSTNPGTAYKIPWWNGQLSWEPGDYIKFFATGDATNPWNAVQYNSGGTQKDVMGTGHIINMSSDYFFFVGNDNDTGQLFSMTSGLSDSNGVTWTGTLNPTVAQVNTYSAGGSTAPLAAGQTTTTTGPAAPTVTSTSTTNSTSSSTSYGGSSYSNVPTMGTTPAVNANGEPVVIYHQDNTQIIATPVTVTTTTTPVTTINYSDGTSTTSSGTSTSTSSTTIEYSANVQPNPAPVMSVDSSSVNWLHLNQIGNNNNITVNQTGRGNQVRGVNQQAAVVTGNNNSITIEQAGLQNGPNRVDLFVQGSFNTVSASQGTGAGSSSGHYNLTSITGNNNQVTSSQNNSGGVGSQYNSTTVYGNNNSVNATQSNNGSKTTTTTINGDYNNVLSTQSGTGQHSLSTTLVGNGNSANVTQTGSYSATASITLTNAGGPSSATLVQNANTGNAAYSINQTCVTPSGCSVSVTQNK